MLNKNLTYYRLKQRMSKKALAEAVGVSQMSITNYENGARVPSMEIVQKIADCLGVAVVDFLSPRDESLMFQHGEFRKNCSLSKGNQDLVRESIEEYFNRFFTIVDILGNAVLATPPSVECIVLNSDDEVNAKSIRQWLNIAPDGPVPNLISLLENRGVLVHLLDFDSDHFSGINGKINGRPYIVVNSNMTPERQRSTIVHELAHFLFAWPADLSATECEKRATAISGAFLFSQEDAIRELGIRRSSIAGDMFITAEEYGISMQLLAKRAHLCHIINDQAYKDFFITVSRLGWRKNEPSRIAPEATTLFKQLVYRAVVEGSITIQRGAELLQTSFKEVEEDCFSDEV